MSEPSYFGILALATQGTTKFAPATPPTPAGDAQIAGLGRGVAATRCGDPELLLDPGPLHRGSWDIWDWDGDHMGLR